jgi:hypothetical protein
MRTRRAFMTLVGGAAAAWPLGARAQQSERVRRVGVLSVTREADPETPLRVTAFRQALGKLGWSEGRNVVIDFRWGVRDPNQARAHVLDRGGVASRGSLNSTANDGLARVKASGITSTPALSHENSVHGRFFNDAGSRLVAKQRCGSRHIAQRTRGKLDIRLGPRV